MKEEFQDFILSLPTTCPTLIKKEDLTGIFTQEQIHKLLYHGILSQPLPQHYGLVDEFLRTRILFDSIESSERVKEIESGIILKKASQDILDIYHET